MKIQKIFILVMVMLLSACSTGNSTPVPITITEKPCIEVVNTTNAKNIPFSSVIKSIDAVGDYPFTGEPDILIIQSLDEFEQYSFLKGLDTQKLVNEIDFSNKFLLIALQGYKPSLSYSISITSIMEAESSLIVFADVVLPTSVTEELNAVAYPYHVVEIARKSNFEKMESVHLVINNCTVAKNEISIK